MHRALFAAGQSDGAGFFLVEQADLVQCGAHALMARAAREADGMSSGVTTIVEYRSGQTGLYGPGNTRADVLAHEPQRRPAAQDSLLTSTVPLVAWSMPATSRSRVDLLAPERPENTISPFSP